MSPEISIRWGRFVWNGEKERINVIRQRIGFRAAARAFQDPYRIITPDEKHSHQEKRRFCIGRVGSEVVTVRFTYRGRQIRIFGAGIWRKGRKLYEEKTKISTRP
jgi:uncharacterized DUF497 family protein